VWLRSMSVSKTDMISKEIGVIKFTCSALKLVFWKWRIFCVFLCPYVSMCTGVHSAVLRTIIVGVNPLNPELNPMCCLLALLGAHHFLHVSRIRVKSLTFRRLMSYIYIWSTHS